MGMLKNALLESGTAVLVETEEPTTNDSTGNATALNEAAVLPESKPVTPPDNIVGLALDNVEMPPLFRVTPRGLEHMTRGEDGQPVWEYVCGPVWVIGYARNSENTDWYKVVRMLDPDRMRHELLIPLEDFSGDSRNVLAQLHRHGLRMSSEHRARLLLRQYLMEADPRMRIRLVSEPGWHGDIYLHGNCVIGNSPTEAIRLSPGVGVNSRLARSGTYEEWREMAKLAEGNSRLLLAMSTGFAAPLVKVAGAESGGHHIFGASTTGKSTTQNMAGSIFGGGPRGYGLPWKTTANGMEAVCAMHMDALVCFDEIGEANPKEMGPMVYTTFNGQGKSRMKADGTLRQQKQWRLMMLSTGEKRMVECIQESGDKVKAGQEIRLCDIPADAGAGFGIFEDLHGFPGGKDLAEHINAQCMKHYGWAAPMFIEKVIEQREMVVDYIQEVQKNFIEACVPPGADGQVGRVANRFALCAAAGELARFWNIVPWPEGEALNGASTCFAAWLEQRGGTAPGEVLRGVEQVVSILRTDGMKLFDVWGRQGGCEAVEGAKVTSYGWRRLNEDKVWEFYAHKDGFNALLKGFNRKQLAPALVECGLLAPETNGTLSVVKKIPGMGAQRVYHLRPHLYRDSEDSNV